MSDDPTCIAILTPEEVSKASLMTGCVIAVIRCIKAADLETELVNISMSARQMNVSILKAHGLDPTDEYAFDLIHGYIITKAQAEELGAFNQYDEVLKTFQSLGDGVQQ